MTASAYQDFTLGCLAGLTGRKCSADALCLAAVDRDVAPDLILIASARQMHESAILLVAKHQFFEGIAVLLARGQGSWYNSRGSRALRVHACTAGMQSQSWQQMSGVWCTAILVSITSLGLDYE